MIGFIFDENLSDKRLVRHCRSEGLCEVKAYPRGMRGTKDPQMLQAISSSTDTLVTLDLPIVEEHHNHIGPENPGVIIIQQSTPGRTMTTKIGAELLRRFKDHVLSWHKLVYHDVVLTISESGVALSSRNLEIPAVILIYTDNNFEATFVRELDLMRAAIAS